MNFLDRLEKLRLTKDLTWSQMGELLDLSRSMLHYVRTGKRVLSPRAMARLEKAEQEAGLSSPEAILREQFSIAGQIADLSTGTEEEKQEVFSAKAISPELASLAELRADIKNILKRMNSIEQAVLANSEAVAQALALFKAPNK